MTSEEILDQPPIPADRRVPYGEAPSQFVDLRFPEGDGPFPGIVLIHGGFWKAEYSLDYFGHVAEALRSAGLVVANIEYRRVGESGGGWPGTFTDVAAAARLFVDQAEEWRLDPARMIVVGHSAGGHLALWLAGRHRVDTDSPIAGPVVDLVGAVSLGGVADLIDVDRRRLGDDAVRDLLGGDHHVQRGRYRAASPAALLPLGVPQLLVHGDMDADVPFAHAEQYLAAARSAGDPIEAIFLTEIGHFEIVDPRSEAWPLVLKAILDLLPGVTPPG